MRGTPCRRQAATGSDLCGFHLKRRGGRPTLLTEELADELVRLLSAGNYDETAAKAAGVAPRTFREWLQRGLSLRDADEPYRQLRRRVDEARAKGEATHVARIAKAAQDGDWKASAWYLERAHPERWGKPGARPIPRERDELEEPHAPDLEPVETPLGLFDEIDELARKRAQRQPT